MDFLTVPLVVEWISKLTGRLVGIRGNRKKELQAISDVLGADVEQLARYYVQPRAQVLNPADEDEDQPLGALRADLREALNNFLTKEFVNPTGQQFFFILADAGMGKSSLLAMLKLTHLLKFWPQDVRFELLKLGPSTLDDVKSLPDARKTILLLDSLDEDPEAFGGDVRERLQDLMAATKGFRQVILTCRTQFFPKDADIEKPGRISVGDYERCNLLYLSPFSDEQVAEYLDKRFPKEEDWKKAAHTVKYMRSLRMRPMLLAYIEDLVDEEREDWNEFTIYETLLEKWLIREAQKGVGVDREQLKAGCLELARRLQIDGERYLTRGEFDRLARNHPELVEIPKLALEGRALLNRTGKGEFRFAHFSIQEFLAVAGLAWGKFDYTEEVFRRTEMTDVFASGVTWPCIAAKVSLFSKFVRRNASHYFLVGAILTDADLSHAYLRGANLTKADLTGANLTRANFTDASLMGTTLLGANFLGADFVGANFSGADLEDADLTGADLSKAIVTEAQLATARHRPWRREPVGDEVSGKSS